MLKVNQIALLFLAVFWMAIGSATGQAQQTSPVVYEDITGVQLLLNPDGSFRGVKATGDADLELKDRRAVRSAIKRAEMRAKASIAKFMKESLKTEDTLEDITKTCIKASSDEKNVSRNTVMTEIEKISNSAEAILRGVVTLEQKILKEESLVQVTVGVKEQTRKAAGALSNMMSDDYGKSKTGSTEYQKIEGNTIRRSPMADGF